MIRTVGAAILLAASALPAFAADPAVPARLSCDQIAARIQALNVPISNDSSTIAGFQRSPTIGFALLGIGSRSPEYMEMLNGAISERRALIQLAVEKDCAAQRLMPMPRSLF